MTKTVTPGAARRQPAGPDRRDRPRDAQLDRAPEPGHRPLPRLDAAAAGRARRARSGRRWAASCPEDYARLCARLDRRHEVVAIELNLSCPNVASPEGDAAEIVAAARAATDRPLYAKLSAAVPGPRCRGAGGAGGGRRRPLARQHRARPRPRRAHACARGSGPRRAATPGPALKPVALAAVLLLLPRDRPADRRHGRHRDRPRCARVPRRRGGRGRARNGAVRRSRGAPAECDGSSTKSSASEELRRLHRQPASPTKRGRCSAPVVAV